jgi:serine/threonine protein kinase
MFNGIGEEDALIREMIKLAGALPNRWEACWDTNQYQKLDGGGHTLSVRRYENSDDLGLGMLETDPEASWNKRRIRFLSGPTDDATIKSVDESINLLRHMLILDPKDRSLATELLLHPWFEGARENWPLPASPTSPVSQSARFNKD